MLKTYKERKNFYSTLYLAKEHNKIKENDVNPNYIKNPINIEMLENVLQDLTFYQPINLEPLKKFD